MVGDERAIKAVVRDWGNGHIEIDWSPGYQAPFEWFGGASGPAVADFVAALERRDGAEAAQQRIMEGPAHALIFPNLFLGETNIAIVEPLGVEECVHWHTPMFLEGRARVQRPPAAHGRGGHGPRVVPDAGGPDRSRRRNQLGLHARTAEWLAAEPRASTASTWTTEGRAVSHVTDETTNRGLWQHYRAVMTRSA